MTAVRSVRVEVIGPGGDVVDVVDLVEGLAVRVPGPAVRLIPDDRSGPVKVAASKRGGDDGA